MRREWFEEGDGFSAGSQHWQMEGRARAEIEESRRLILRVYRRNQARERRRRDPEHMREINRRYRSRHPDRVLISREQQRIRRRVPLDQYRGMCDHCGASWASKVPRRYCSERCQQRAAAARRYTTRGMITRRRIARAMIHGASFGIDQLVLLTGCVRSTVIRTLSRMRQCREIRSWGNGITRRHMLTARGRHAYRDLGPLRQRGSPEPDPQLAELVQLLYCGGMTMVEIARVLGRASSFIWRIMSHYRIERRKASQRSHQTVELARMIGQAVKLMLELLRMLEQRRMVLRRRRGPELAELVRLLYYQGLSIREIGDVLWRDPTAIWKLIRHHGITARVAGRRSAQMVQRAQLVIRAMRLTIDLALMLERCRMTLG